MPDLQWNVKCWSNSYDWGGEGEEWSKSWGNSEAQWFGSIYPRIHKFIPCKNILEIATGHGRWTRFLTNYTSESFWGVDISKHCIEACEKQFGNTSKARFFCNDGKNLSPVHHVKFDFIYSFDSLVHADINIFQSYIPEIMKVLSPVGVCFLHHSNFKYLIDRQKKFKKTPLEKRHYRDDSTSGEILKEIIEQSGGRVLLQEYINWGGKDLIDCFTLFTKNSSFKDIPYKVIKNTKFMDEASLIKESVAPYCF